MAFTRYSDPPLVEAVQEFRFASESTKALAEVVPRLATHFLNAGFSKETILTYQETAQTGSDTAELRKSTLYRYSTSDGGTVVTFSNELFGVSYLTQSGKTPYPGWADAHREAIKWLKFYLGALTGAEVQTATVRYDNRLPIVREEFVASRFLDETSKLLPPVLFQEQNPFTSSCSRPTFVTDEYFISETIRVAVGEAESLGPVLGIIIDETVIPRVALRDLEERCRELHTAAHVTFENIFTSEVLQQFGPLNARHEVAAG